MDHFPVYYGSPDTLYHILEDQDSGVDELPFAAYSNFYETESPTPMSDKSLELSFFGGNHDNKSGDDDGDDEEENDLEFVDDDEDYDYRPNKSCMSKRVSPWSSIVKLVLTHSYLETGKRGSGQLTVQTQIRCHIMWHLIRVCIVS